MLLGTRSALAADGDLLDDAERAALDAQIVATRAVAQRDDHHAIESAIKALSAATESFAAARMNRGIRKALAGRSVQDL